MGKNYTIHGRTQNALDAYADLVRATGAVGKLLSRQAESFELTLPQFRVLEVLLHGGAMTQTRLCDEIFFSESNLTHLLRKLEAQELISRRTNSEDKRQWIVELTAKGRARIEKVFPHHADVVRARMNALTGGELKTLARLCRKLADGDALRFLTELKKSLDVRKRMRGIY